jgi:hypothetical protein
LVEFSEVLGLYRFLNRYNAIAEISAEIVFCGVRELVNKLNVPILQKLCLELRLTDEEPKEKEYLVNRFMHRLETV